MLSGGNHDIDVDDLRTNTRYTGGYSEGSRAIKLFWEVMVLHNFEDKCGCSICFLLCQSYQLLGRESNLWDENHLFPLNTLLNFQHSSFYYLRNLFISPWNWPQLTEKEMLSFNVIISILF